MIPKKLFTFAQHMLVQFFKYQGTGNDFILIDNRQQEFPKNNTKHIARLCDRKFGIGADGLILLELSEFHDFKMIYYNADGNEGTMCGNGGRCTVAFARQLGLIDKKTVFEAVDGLHDATIENDIVSLRMGNVSVIEEFDDHIFLNTGSPHHVEFVSDVSETDVVGKGKQIRFGAPYFEEGSNVNFVEQIDAKTFKVRTYERGVENETLSCGTGVTAVAIASHKSLKTKEKSIILDTLGGKLEVSFDVENSLYNNVFLKGKATFVYKGKMEI